MKNTIAKLGWFDPSIENQKNISKNLNREKSGIIILMTMFYL